MGKAAARRLERGDRRTAKDTAATRSSKACCSGSSQQDAPVSLDWPARRALRTSHRLASGRRKVSAAPFRTPRPAVFACATSLCARHLRGRKPRKSSFPPAKADRYTKTTADRGRRTHCNPAVRHTDGDDKGAYYGCSARRGSQLSRQPRHCSVFGLRCRAPPYAWSGVRRSGRAGRREGRRRRYILAFEALAMLFAACALDSLARAKAPSYCRRSSARCCSIRDRWEDLGGRLPSARLLLVSTRQREPDRL